MKRFDPNLPTVYHPFFIPCRCTTKPSPITASSASSVEDGEKSSLEFDPRALPSLVFMPSGRAVLYAVREKGVDNLWVQPLDGSARRQLTHFTSEKIGGYEYSKDGTRLAVGRGHADSDAILLRNIPH